MHPSSTASGPLSLDEGSQSPMAAGIIKDKMTNPLMTQTGGEKTKNEDDGKDGWY